MSTIRQDDSGIPRSRVSAERLIFFMIAALDALPSMALRLRLARRRRAVRQRLSRPGQRALDARHPARKYAQGAAYITHLVAKLTQVGTYCARFLFLPCG